MFDILSYKGKRHYAIPVNFLRSRFYITLFIGVLVGLMLAMPIFGYLNYRHSQFSGVIDNLLILLDESGKQVKIKDNTIKELRKLRAARVVVTTYNSEAKQTDSTPYITAINTNVGVGGCAVSRDLLAKGFTFGRKIWVEGLGVFVINDIMNDRFTNRIDIWQTKDKPLLKLNNALMVLIE